MAQVQPNHVGDIHMRVEDYLDDQIQTVADLENVEDLLSRVQQQQDLLRKQLAEARQTLSESRANIHEKSNALQQSAKHFQTQQKDLDRRLQILTQSEASDDATKRIESRMGKVRSLEIANGYLELVQRANALTKRARDSLAREPETSLRAYLQLRAIWNKVQEAQPGAEGAAPQLIYLLEQEVTQLYQELKSVLSDDFRKTLEVMKWPGKDLNLAGGIQERWQRQVELLLELQEPDLLKFAADKLKFSSGITPDPVILLPLKTMVQPLATRFRYHFYGERPTNRLDKPEYFLSHVLDLIDQHNNFISNLLGPIIDERALTSDALEMVYTDAVSSFISALLPMVNAKCLSFLPQITSEPQLLSHFMREAMSFDNAIRDSWVYVPIPRMLNGWRGVTWTILYSHGYFPTWLAVEKDFALARYTSIKDSPDSREIDLDAEPSQTKPTKGAIRVNDLLETITDRYRSLSSFSYKMNFLLDIQLSIFDDYHNYLHDALQAYIAVSHTAGRLLQGQSETDTFGLKGLESLTKIFGSAAYLERKMSDWSDDLFFLELWDELLTRSKANTGNNSIGNNLRVDDVAAKTSSAIKAHSADEETESDGSGLFDQTAAAYRRLRERSEEEVVRAFDVNVRNALRTYGKQPQWSSLGDAPSDATALTPSSALDSLFQTISVLLGFLAHTFALGSLRRVTKHFCTSIQREIYDNVVMHNTFSAAGAAQLRRDLSAIEESIEKSTRVSGAIGASMKRIEEAVYLLALPASKAKAGTNNESDGWGFDEDDDDQPSAIDARGGSRYGEDVEEWGLWDAEKRVFESNEAAREALADMGLFHLSESDARNILKRRIELNS
ncbi:uncharacterized protein A1O9_07077 [Exophiala aquamarina CBS 119918]|uniref:RINT-1 family protein n=1 Tax=Exophiala aquamarina CBS 119918 TaxID=1182545 RepID=A0A072PAV6_9EURO|nr:uncharacterized protein A1O9_07077 [Exophiala aquamarina CBS 119918]KEF56887.1 hypothetical protein A1O9_07077 [Exophiala aquamarina CBS 119918]